MAVIQPLGSSNSSASNNNQINDAFRQLNREQIVKTFKQANGSNGLVQGVLPNNQGYGELLYDSDGNARIGMRIVGDVPELKVAKAGYSVLNATNDQLIFNSNQNVFKIAASGTVTMSQITLTGSSGIGRATVEHNLGIVPVVIAIFASTSTPDNYSSWVSDSGAVITSGGFVQFTSYHARLLTATTTTVKFEESYYWGGVPAPNTAGPYTIKYYLLQESAN